MYNSYCRCYDNGIRKVWPKLLQEIFTVQCTAGGGIAIIRRCHLHACNGSSQRLNYCVQYVHAICCVQYVHAC